MPVFAVDFVISDNSNGNNEVHVSAQQQTTVSQSNQAVVENTIATVADTGNNTASNNAGQSTTIDTGSVTESVTVENSLNTSVVNAPSCCTDNENILISNNTNSGDNAAHFTNNNTTRVSMYNTATVQNTINISANTGNNTASYNNGNTSIATGSIIVDTIIKNATNNATAIVPVSGNGDIRIFILNNTNAGNNVVRFDGSSQNILNVTNSADIQTDTRFNLNTGNNSAVGSIGGVSINTGDIFLTATISNTVNDSLAKLPCCDTGIGGPVLEDPDDPGEDEEKLPPVDQNQPSPDNSKIGSASANNSGTGGSGSGSVLGSSLPSTGTGWWVYATIANILMFLLGLYLRMRAGRSPTNA